MENKMIKWFIDNLKPAYYEKMISTQVTHFASLIPIGDRIEEGIRSKKIMDAESLSSMVEQQSREWPAAKVAWVCPKVAWASRTSATPMMENEMIKWFIDNLKPPYYEKMIST